MTGDRALCVWAWVGVGNLGDKLRSGLALGTHETQAQPPPPAISTSCRRAAKVITSFRHQQQADFESSRRTMASGKQCLARSCRTLTCAPTMPCLIRGRSVSHWARCELKSGSSLPKLLRMHHGRSLWLCQMSNRYVIEHFY